MKKYLVCLTLLFGTLTCYPQSVNSLLDSAITLQYRQHNYQAAAEVYDKLLKDKASSYLKSIPRTYRYAAACYSVIGNADHAFHYLDLAKEKEWVNSADITGDTLFNHLKKDKRWAALIVELDQRKDNYLASLNPANYSLLDNIVTQTISKLKGDTNITAETVYHRLTGWNRYPVPSKTGITLKYFNQINDTLKVPFNVYVPKSYNPKVPAKLLVYIGGGWWGRSKPLKDEARAVDFENPTRSYLNKQNCIEIYINSYKEVSLLNKNGFINIEMAVLKVKKLFNINDNAVFLAGFSDGASSAYLMAMYNPTLFARFYPINGFPLFLPPYFSNLSNRSLYSFSAEKDGLYNINEIKEAARFSAKLGVDWKFKMMEGKGHFYYDYEDQVLPLVFDNIKQTKRVALGNHITWFTDKDAYGGCDWLRVVTDLNRPVLGKVISDNYQAGNKGKWEIREYGSKLSQTVASFVNNTFIITTSKISMITVLINPEMVDLSRQIKIVVNGKGVFDAKIEMDKDFMIANFLEKADRSQVWVNKITVKVP